MDSKSHSMLKPDKEESKFFNAGLILDKLIALPGRKKGKMIRMGMVDGFEWGIGVRTVDSVAQNCRWGIASDVGCVAKV